MIAQGFTDGEVRRLLDSRPSFDDIFMELARDFAERSTCRRLKVGCVIVPEDYRSVYGFGYNGNARHFSNDCDTHEPGACGCLHAEDNAVINCRAPFDAPKIVYCTHLPCKMCAKRLVNLGGVKVVRYRDEYRLLDALDVFKEAGINFLRVR